MPLTPEQRAALWTPEGFPFRGHRVVSARPGTGKTTTLTDYCIEMAKDWHINHAPWQGMAIVSYTNVAKDELERKIRKLGRANSLLGYPHFVGTMDSFVNKFLFLPFGACFMGFNGGRIKLVGEPYGHWRTPKKMHTEKPSDAMSPIFFDCYGVDLGGAPYIIDTSPREVDHKFISAKDVSLANSSKISKMKQYVWLNGYAVQSDANYIAYKTLESSPILAQSFIDRFPVFIIDEAQDMTGMQHALLDHLRRSGQQHIILIGDEYQAIYEWNTARPQLFMAKKRDDEWSPKEIRETFRCSSAICSVLNSMTCDNLVLSPAASGKNKDYAEPVQVRVYEGDHEQGDVRLAIDELARALSEKVPHDSNKDNMNTLAVIARSRDDVSRLQAYFTGEPAGHVARITWGNKFTKDYMKVVFALSCKDLHRAVDAYETLLFNISDHRSKSAMRSACAAEWASGKGQWLDYRATLIEDLRKIIMLVHRQAGAPLKMSTCALFCDVKLRGLQATVLAQLKQDCRSFANGGKSGQDRLLSSLFFAQDERFRSTHPTQEKVALVFSTVHGVKGETYDGVIFYTKKVTSSCGCSTSRRKWVDILRHDLIECENKRIAYVAISRAAQMLYVLTPRSSEDAWNSLLTSASS